jgi:hypothetical protein
MELDIWRLFSRRAPRLVTCVDADCRLEDDYCTGCDCRALSSHIARVYNSRFAAVDCQDACGGAS